MGHLLVAIYSRTNKPNGKHPHMLVGSCYCKICCQKENQIGDVLFIKLNCILTNYYKKLNEIIAIE